MRLLHTSDWHLGMKEGERSLGEDQSFFIEEICRIAEEYAVEAVIIAGDIFDRSNPAADAVVLYDKAMTKLCIEHGKRVIAIAGNHDSQDRIGNCSELLARAGLHVLGAADKEPVIVSLGDTDIYLLPWIKENMVRGLFPEEAENIKSTEDAYRVMSRKLEEHFRPGRKNILVAHAFMTNAEVSDSDKAAVIGFADQAGVEVFSAFDYVALGHIHKPQDIGSNARYSGTPMPYSFGAEEKQEKSVTILDTETMERTIVPLKQLHKRVTLKGTLDELLTDEYPEDILNGYVKLEVTDTYVGLDAISRLSARFPSFLQITGKTFDDGEQSIRMTMEEFTEMKTNPAEVLKSFYRDIMEAEPDARILELFMECVEECEEEE